MTFKSISSELKSSVDKDGDYVCYSVGERVESLGKRGGETPDYKDTLQIVPTSYLDALKKKPLMHSSGFSKSEGLSRLAEMSTYPQP